jgi:hypothetical protein
MSRAGMANLITRLRELTNTKWDRLTDADTGDGTTKVYWLTHKPNESGGTVSLGGTIQGTAAYTWDTEYGRVEFDTAPTVSVAVLVEYRFSDMTDDHAEDVLESNCTLIENSPLAWMPTIIADGTTEYYKAETPYRDLEGTASGTAYWTVRDSNGNIISTSGYSVDERQGLVTFSVDQAGSIYYLTARSYDVWAAAADMWTEKAARYSEQFSFSSDSQSFSRKELIANALEMSKKCRSKAGQNKQRGELQSSSFVRTDINRSVW